MQNNGTNMGGSEAAPSTEEMNGIGLIIDDFGKALHTINSQCFLYRRKGMGHEQDREN